MLSTICKWRALVVATWLFANFLPTALAAVDYLPMSFFFNWDPPGQTFPVTTTPQCDTIHITWSRSTAAGPNPVPPYYLQVYTSLFLVPIIIPAGMGLSYDWPVPFPPGTLYQICMFDSNGNTGGCQATYTMIPATTGVANCVNATIPPQLDVEGIVANGPISRYGWIEQCTDVEVRAKNGTPPYTFTIAPALHPPFNITGPGPNFNWTVDLTWASPFFISLADSAGNMWSHGLLHSGGPGSDSCLTNSTAKAGSKVSPGATVGSAFGGLFLGALLGLGGMFLFTKKKIQRLESEALLDLNGDYSGGHRTGGGTSYTNSTYQPVPLNMGAASMDNTLGSSNPSSLFPRSRMDGTSTNHIGALQYQIEPFTLPSEEGRLLPPSPPPPAPSNLQPNRGNSLNDPNRAENKIYVVHHASNAPPVTIYHEDGTEVVELPPRYLDERQSPRSPASPTTQNQSRVAGMSSNPQDARSDITGTTRTSEELPAFLQQQRVPTTARKPGRDIAYTRPLQG